MLFKLLNLREHGLGFDLSAGPTVKMGAYSAPRRRVKRGNAPTCQQEIGQTPQALLSGGIQKGRVKDAREVTG